MTALSNIKQHFRDKAASDWPHDLTQVAIVLNDGCFCDWSALLLMMRSAFKQNLGQIDPPSTVFDCTERDLADRAEHERLLVAYRGAELVGCLFMRPRLDELFLGRFAISPDLQGTGLARRMIRHAEACALGYGLHCLALETRVELRLNQLKFQNFGFVITGGRAHAGYDRTTTLRMEKRVHT